MLKVTNHVSRKLFRILLGMVCGLAFFQYALGVAIPSVVYLALATVLFCACRKEEVLSFVLCCIPLHSMVSLTYTLAIFAVVYAVRFFDSIKLNAVSVCVVISMMLWELLHYAYGGFSLVGFAFNFAPLLVLLLFVGSDMRRLDYAFIARSFAATTLCVCLALLVNLLESVGYDFRMLFDGMQRLGMTFAGPSEQSLSIVNPNTLGILCVFAGTGLFQLILSGRGCRYDLLAVMLLLVFGAMTLSRTFLACLAAAAILLLLSAKGGAGQKTKVALALVAVMAFALIFLYFFFPGLLDYFYGRFQTEDITTGRTATMAAYHEFLMSNPDAMFFGVGLQDLHEKLVVRRDVAVFAPHNGIQEIVLVWGVLGLLMLCLLIGMMVRCSRSVNKRQCLLNYVPLLIVLIKMQAGQMITSPYTLLALSLAYVSLCCDFFPRKESH